MEEKTKDELLETQNHIIKCLEEQNRNLQRRIYYLEHDLRVKNDKFNSIDAKMLKFEQNKK